MRKCSTLFHNGFPEPYILRRSTSDSHGLFHASLRPVRYGSKSLQRSLSDQLLLHKFVPCRLLMH